MSGTLSAAERTYNVLFIQSYTKNTPWHSLLTENLENGLKKGGVRANIITEYLNADYWSFASECFIMRRICQRARQRKTDLIVTSSDEAFFTLTHCGDSLPYQIPVVVSGIKYPDERVFERMPNVSGHVSKTDFDVLLDAAVRMFPSRRELVCLSDSSFLSLKGVRAVEDSWERIKSNYPEHELKVLNVQAKSLNSIITSICYDYNAYKHIVIAPKWIPFLSLKLKAPVFTSQNLAMTNGVLCVYDAVPGEDAFAAGRQAASILKGKSPASLGVKDFGGKLLFDYKQLQFFRVDTNRAESKGIILNIPLMERYRVWFILFYSLIVGALVLLVAWLFRANRRESRKRIHAQTRLLIQHRLVEQRDEFDNIFCSIRDGLITYDTDLRIHFVNRPLLQMLGLSSETYTSRFYEGQMAGSIFRIYMNGENILQDLLKKVRTGKRPISIPEKAFMQENHQGTYFPVSGEVVPIFANEKMTGMAIVCRNISEEEMQRRFFNMAVEESSIYPWQYNMHMNRFHFPGGLLRRFGYTGDTDLLARDEMDTLIHPEDLLHTRRNFDAILLGNEINSRMSFRLKSADGSYEWWEFRSTAYDGLTVDTPYMVLGVCQSIQRYKDTEEALIAARDQDGPGREPLKLTLDAAALGMTGTALADVLRGGQLECEYADPRYVVLMFTPCNPPQDYARLRIVLRQCLHSLPAAGRLPQPEELAGEFMALAQQARAHCTIRQAVFAPQERIPVQQALGRICAMPTVSCPPAIPIAVSGEEITPAALELMQRYGVTEVSVLRR